MRKKIISFSIIVVLTFALIISNKSIKAMDNDDIKVSNTYKLLATNT